MNIVAIITSCLLALAATAAAQPAMEDLAEDSPLRVDQSDTLGTAIPQWLMRTVDGKVLISGNPAHQQEIQLPKTLVAELVAMISGPKKTPLPLERIHIGKLLESHQLQEYLMDQFQEHHQRSLWNEIGGADVQRSPSAPPLRSMAVEVLRESPEM